MEKVVIVVPHHKAEFSKNEKVSLEQLHRVLGNYPIYVVAPEQLKGKLSLYDWKYKFVSECAFGSKDRYSKTFMSSWLYELFGNYEYMMIYHTDSFVFSDKLLEFCSLGYDYIGAPWNSYDPATRKIGIRVGNGGFCIKKISSVLNVLNHKDEILVGHPMREHMEKMEDTFFAYCGLNKNISFTVPDISTASKFAIEHSINNSLCNLNEAMPFGCHDWYRLNYKVWRPYIESFGYVTDSSESQGDEIDFRIHCLMSYFEESRFDQKLVKSFNRVAEKLPSKLAIWGYGDYGKIFEKILKLVNKKVTIFDKKVYIPSTEEMKRQLIIISTRKYEKDIAKELIEKGLIEGTNFITFGVIIEEILNGLFPEG